LVARPELALFSGTGFLLFGVSNILVNVVYFTRANWRRLTTHNPRFYVSQFYFRHSKPGFLVMLIGGRPKGWDKTRHVLPAELAR
jgi:hypothetical protein